METSTLLVERFTFTEHLWSMSAVDIDSLASLMEYNLYGHRDTYTCSRAFDSETVSTCFWHLQSYHLLLKWHGLIEFETQNNFHDENISVLYFISVV